MMGQKKFQFLLSSLSLIFILLATSSCSLFQRSPLAPKTIGDGSDPKKYMASDYVSRSDYDKLSKKFETLKDEYEQLLNSVNTKNTNTKEREISSNEEAPLKLPSESNELQPTVTLDDADHNELPKELPIETSSPSTPLEKEIDIFSQTRKLMDQKKWSSALLNLQSLEKSESKQIKVRAKFYLGEIFFVKSELDLALQVYEEIVTKYAFSSYVIPSLERLKVITEKLLLKEKGEKYSLLYNNFFSSKAPL